MSGVSLPKVDKAPILNGYIAHAESVLDPLYSQLGSGDTAAAPIKKLDTSSLDSLDTRVTKDQSGQFIHGVKENSDVVKDYQSHLHTLDVQVADIASKAAQMSDSTRKTVQGKIGDIKSIIESVRTGSYKTADGHTVTLPTAKDQLDAISNIEPKVQSIVKTIDDMHNDKMPQTAKQTPRVPTPPGGPDEEDFSAGRYQTVSYDSQYSSAGFGTPVAPSVAASSPHVDQWVKEAITLLEQQGIPASKLDPNAIKLIIAHESGGNPDAINRTDSNAQAGHPSEGLMQTIASTFQANASAGHDNILNPVDNIMAGVKYALGRYGSLDNVPGVLAVEQGGSYVGY